MGKRFNLPILSEILPILSEIPKKCLNCYSDGIFFLYFCSKKKKNCLNRKR